MTDHIPNDLSHLSDAEFHSLCPQGEHAPGPEPLSPAAQAVLDAAADVYWDWADMSPASSYTIAAAVLRAAADQVTPLSTNLKQNNIRYELLAIANELEGNF
jgi:hypothetical protein